MSVAPVSGHEFAADNESTGVAYTVRMTDGQEYVWDGVSTALVGYETFLLGAQGTRMSLSQVVTMTPVDD